MRYLRVRNWGVVAAALGWVLAAGNVCRAEMYADVALGSAITENDVASLANIVATDPAERESFGVEGHYDKSFDALVRVGYWFESAPLLGLAGTASYFRPDMFGTPVSSKRDVNLRVIPVSVLLMGRIPLLTDNRYPNGRLQPFAGIGPAAFITDVWESDFSDLTLSGGLDLHVGGRVMLTPRFGFFTQYRFTQFQSHPEDKDAGLAVEMNLVTHHLLGGLSVNF